MTQQRETRAPIAASILTFDVFSALINSRAGGSTFFSRLASEQGWKTTGPGIYGRWDLENKQLHRSVREWVPFRTLSETALSITLRAYDLPTSRSRTYTEGLLASMREWPLWPDVSPASLARLHVDKLGLLSNIDDDLLATTAVMQVGLFDPELVITSERVRAYKPSHTFYDRARHILGPFTHIASSARDVDGAVRAGATCIRLIRPGHDPYQNGATPERSAESLDALRVVLADARRRRPAR